MVQKKRQRLNLVIDPRFSGGTSSAVAREIYALAPLCDLSVTAISSRLFKGKDVHPSILRACEDMQVPLVWDPSMVSSDLVALHNPSFLKFDEHLGTNIVCDRLFVVCHENFIGPDGTEGFDVGHCLSLISGQTLSRKKFLSPVSQWNRQCTEKWLAARPSNWELAPEDWTNICDFEFLPPTALPKDRRGRHSRPGAEKFPPREDLEKMFPPSCERVRMLGADGLLDTETPPHWELLNFGTEQVDDFLQSIDFFIYFTHPFLQESFGRVIAEAIAAGKLVITSPAIAATFSDALVTAAPDDVDTIVQHFIADPKQYAAQVRRSQAALSEFGVPAFLRRFEKLITSTQSKPHPAQTMETLYDFL